VAPAYSECYPRGDALLVGLNTALRDNNHGTSITAVLDRHQNPYASTFPSEAVSCRFEDGREATLLCKYISADGRSGYESAVYQYVLQPLSCSVPTFYGTYADPTNGAQWLILQDLDGCLRINQGPQPQTVALAAQWVGRFHAVNEARVADPSLAFVRSLDAQYHARQSRRTIDSSKAWQETFPWLVPLCHTFDDLAGRLDEQPQTVIHGEFYPENVLFLGGRVYPVDWETAAVGAGEIDLACITEGWTLRAAQACEQAYVEARWPEGPPPEFHERLELARLLIQLRWLANLPEQEVRIPSRRLLAMRRSARRLGLLERRLH
jgi:Phosphotransferase enzyme family